MSNFFGKLGYRRKWYIVINGELMEGEIKDGW